MAHVEKWTPGTDGKPRWRARWRTPSGESRSKVFDRKSDAQRHLAAMEHAKMTAAYVDPSAGKVTFGDWWDEWSASRVGLRPSTRARDDSYARSLILPALGSRSLASLDHLTAQRWVNELAAREVNRHPIAPATVRMAHRLASSAMRAAVRARLVAANPFDGTTLPNVERREMRFLTPDDVATLRDTIDERYTTLVLVGAYAGLRFGELAGLRRGRVDLVARRIDVAENAVEVSGKHYFGPPKTKAGRRSVPIPRVVADALADHVAGLAPDALVFAAPQGGALRASLFRRRFWHPAVERAGLAPLRVHDLRHTAVAFWIAAGATPFDIARRAGHTSTSVVLDRYGHLLPGAEDRVTDALDAIAAAAVPSPSAGVVSLASRRRPASPARHERSAT